MTKNFVSSNISLLFPFFFTEERDLNRIPSDFFYDLEPLLCTPFKSESCPLTSSVLTLYHSFGYNCLMRCNLHVLDKNTLVFAAGAVLQFVNLTTLTYSYVLTRLQVKGIQWFWTMEVWSAC